VPLLDKLARFTCPSKTIILSHLATALLNFFRDEESEKELNAQGAGGVALFITQLEDVDPNTAQICALALSHHRNVPKRYVC